MRRVVRMHLATPGRVGQADLAHGEHLTGARAVGDRQLDLGVSQLPGVGAALFIGVEHSVNALSAMSGVGPLHQVRVSNPAACRSANKVGDQPPRSNPTSTLRSSPTRARRSGISQRNSAARGSPGWAITTSSGSPPASVTQVSSVAGAGNFNRGTWVLAILRVP